MKPSQASKRIIYLGFNHMLKHKRGVENVIDFQTKASPSKINYYIHWDDITSVYKYKNLICVGIKANFLRYFIFNWFILRIKKREQNIFIHSHNTLMTMACIFQTNLFTVHDALYYEQTVTTNKIKSIFYILEKFLYKRVGFVHFISSFAKKMSLYSKSGNHRIIYNTSHLETYKVSKKYKFSKHKFGPKKTKIFIVRGMHERSRIDLIIELANEIKGSAYEILIAGKGPLYDNYEKEIKDLKLKNIKLLGYVSDSDIINYYLACDIVLMPAEFAEGFGLPIIEGYLFNKPVIASNRCAIPEVIISHEFLFENTIESIIQKIEYAKSRLTEPYKKYYDKKFSNNFIVNEFKELYKSLM